MCIWTLKDMFEVKSDYSNGFCVYDFLSVHKQHVCSKSQIGELMSHLKKSEILIKYCLTLEEWLKVKSDYTNGFPGYDFLLVDNSNI